MMTLSKDEINIEKEQDIVLFRNRVREMAVKINMTILNQTKLITAASELARNILRYAGKGIGLIEIVTDNIKTGVRLTFRDNGPGIPDISAALRDGFSTGRSLGLGLPGAKRLSDEFSIESKPGSGTTVTILRWKNGV